MTVIVFDGHTIACDSQRTCDGSYATPFELGPKIQVKNGVIYAFAGDVTWEGAFMQWHGRKRRPAFPVTKGDDVSTAAVFERGAWIVYYSTDGLQEHPPREWATGSGARYALVALRCGLSAQQAAKITTEFDIFSGGPIHYANVNELVARGDKSIKTYEK